MKIVFIVIIFVCIKYLIIFVCYHSYLQSVKLEIKFKSINSLIIIIILTFLYIILIETLCKNVWNVHIKMLSSS